MIIEKETYTVSYDDYSFVQWMQDPDSGDYFFGNPDEDWEEF